MFQISIHDIPQEGQNIALNNQDIWLNPLDEFHMQCRIIDPIAAQLTLMPMPGGIMVRGVLTGSIELPCNRCAEPMHVSINAQIDRFEHAPNAALGIMDDFDDTDDDFIDAQETLSHIIIQNAIPVLDLAALCWEEFVLSFPMQPICSTNCQGLCAICGVNLNENTCLCKQDSGDSRFAILRTIKIKDVK